MLSITMDWTLLNKPHPLVSQNLTCLYPTEAGILGHEPPLVLSPVVLKVWSPPQQHPYHLGTYRNAGSWTHPRPSELKTLGSSHLCFSKHSR